MSSGDGAEPYGRRRASMLARFSAWIQMIEGETVNDALDERRSFG